MTTKILKQRYAAFKEAREHDYLYDNTFLVSGRKDHEKNARKAAMATAQITVMPVFDAMFSELKNHASTQLVYHPNARLPEHVDRSYKARLFTKQKVLRLSGTDRYRFFSTPKNPQPLALPLQEPQPEKLPAVISARGPPEDKMVQTTFRESSAQTRPYQPDYYIADKCQEMPEVLYMDEFEFGPDYKVDSGIVERVNRLRLRRAWTAADPRQDVLKQLEAADLEYRDMEVDLMLYRKELEKGPRNVSKADTAAPDRIWSKAAQRIKDRVHGIRRNKERDIRKLNEKHMELLRLSDQRCGRRAPPKLPSSLVRKLPRMKLDPRFLPSSEDFPYTPPQTIHKRKPHGERCSKMVLKDERVLEGLKETLEALPSEECLGVHRYSLVPHSSRPLTPALEVQPPAERRLAAQLLLAVVKGRAIQVQMYEGMSRNAQLIQELLLSIGTKPATQVSEPVFNDLPEALDLEKNKIVGRLMDFLNKELDRLMEEHRLSEMLDLALKEKHWREAAEAGRRQVEERRRKEHDAMYQQIVAVTRRAASVHLEGILRRVGAGEAEAVARKMAEDLAVSKDQEQQQNLNSLEEEDLVAELLLHAVLPEVEKQILHQREDAKENVTHKTVGKTLYGECYEESEEESEESTNNKNIVELIDSQCFEELDDTCGDTIQRITAEPDPITEIPDIEVLWDRVDLFEGDVKPKRKDNGDDKDNSDEEHAEVQDTDGD